MVVVAWTMATAGAAEPDSWRIHGVRGDAHASLGGYGWWGVGLRADLPVLREGILPPGIDDELAISPGAELYFADLNTDETYYGGGVYAIPVVLAQWNVYLGKWSVFPESGWRCTLATRATGRTEPRSTRRWPRASG
jgi:hypothetical protein